MSYGTCADCGAKTMHGELHRENCPRVNPEEETVNHPLHYGGDTVYETIKVIEAWGLDFRLGNAVKYISRAGKKQGSTRLDDLKKAAFYLNREIQREEKKGG